MADVFLYDAVRTPLGKTKAESGLGALIHSWFATGVLQAEECIRPKTDASSLAAMPAGFAVLQDQCTDALGGARSESLHTLSHAPPVCDGAAMALPALARRWSSSA